MSALEDRRDQAREAFYDRAVLPEGEDGHAIEAAIETATRVKITPEVADAYRVRLHGLLAERPTSDELVLQAAFEAAGFEVEP